MRMVYEVCISEEVVPYDSHTDSVLVMELAVRLSYEVAISEG